MECGAVDRAAVCVGTPAQAQQRSMVEEARRIPFFMVVFSEIPCFFAEDKHFS